MGSAHQNLILSELRSTVFGQLEMLSGESRLISISLSGQPSLCDHAVIWGISGHDPEGKRMREIRNENP